MANIQAFTLLATMFSACLLSVSTHPTPDVHVIFSSHLAGPKLPQCIPLLYTALSTAVLRCVLATWLLMADLLTWPRLSDLAV